MIVDDVIDLVGFFVDFILFKIVIVLVLLDIENLSFGELIFCNVLRGGGFQVCVFSEFVVVQIWFSFFVFSCECKGFKCGLFCEFVLIMVCLVMDMFVLMV